jgi:gamma-glutamylcyclotransferase (GGCT)/AIG2-like uncharacterized protein YtfP
MTLYFAYGSNMHRGDMRLRCPGATPLGVAELEGWRFAIVIDGYASILRSPGSRVYGVLWRVNAAGLLALDAYEDLDSGLYRREMVTVQHGASHERALVYIGGRETHGAPLPGYLERLIAAAEEWELPKDYLRELRRWLPARAGDKPS